MENLEKPFYVDSEGLKKLHEEVTILNARLEEIIGTKREVAIADPKDGRLFGEMNDLVVETQRVQEQIRQIYSKIARAVLVESHNEEESIDFGNIIIADMIFGKDDSEEITFKLVGGFGDIRAEIQEISINSPLGSAIYRSKVGDVCTYAVNGNVINVLIKNILKPTNTLEDAPNREGR